MTCVALSINLETFRCLRTDLARRFAHRLDGHPGIASRIRQSTRSGRLLGCGPEPSYARTPVGPGWALVGDAALHQDPWSGLGIDMAAACTPVFFKRRAHRPAGVPQPTQPTRAVPISPNSHAGSRSATNVPDSPAEYHIQRRRPATVPPLRPGLRNAVDPILPHGRDERQHLPHPRFKGRAPHSPADARVALRRESQCAGTRTRSHRLGQDLRLSPRRSRAPPKCCSACPLRRSRSPWTPRIRQRHACWFVNAAVLEGGKARRASSPRFCPRRPRGLIGFAERYFRLRDQIAHRMYALLKFQSLRCGPLMVPVIGEDGRDAWALCWGGGR
jgi:hypothetical protein